jgi:hypothetical protein
LGEPRFSIQSLPHIRNTVKSLLPGTSRAVTP